MVTHFRVRSNRPIERLNLHVSTISPLLKSYVDAFNDQNLQNAMNDEYNELLKNNTWTLVPRPTDANVVRYIWLFRHKLLADETLSRYKARLVASGSTPLSGIDVDETLRKYATEILERAHMASCHPSQTSVNTESKLGDDGDPVSYLTLYKSLAGSLQYLTLLALILLIQCSSRSSVETEYRGVANAIAETCGYKIYYHQRTKHIEIDIHFVRDLVAAGQVRVLHVSSRYQFADIVIKGLPSALFKEFRSSFSVRRPPAQIAEEFTAVTAVAEISMAPLSSLPPPAAQPPKESVVRGYKFVWRILLISNLALGAYIFTRPRKKEAAKKDKKHTELPSTPEMKTAPDSEGTAITPGIEPEKLQVPVPESQWTKPFKCLRSIEDVRHPSQQSITSEYLMRVAIIPIYECPQQYCVPSHLP
uniref:Ribonuclease H-like domain-containing protein n=1 Tax=Tanacetum cinerariifolium TaxID=118510 RepID=A0A6L2NUG8_TANCI|nr:ribonuclease H-like domain-containing protein [Tanacetum cinerariifolium]